MSETVLKFLAEELTLISIVCKDKTCGAILEMTVANLPKNFNGHSCPVCGADFIPPGAPAPTFDYIKNLAESLRGLAALKNSIDFRIIVPVKDKP